MCYLRCSYMYDTRTHTHAGEASASYVSAIKYHVLVLQGTAAADVRAPPLLAPHTSTGGW